MKTPQLFQTAENLLLVLRILKSHRHLVGRSLLNEPSIKELDKLSPPITEENIASFHQITNLVFNAPFAVLSHSGTPFTNNDPIFNFVNQKAIDAFGYSVTDFLTIPSRKSAQPANQAERELFMKTVAKNGFVENYSGIRVKSSGELFAIRNGTVWNVLDESGEVI
ncbi:hypothetical protein HK098_005591 [Nowakowskiella sp. JEL0407]|nr:hypothetical protein HK098_005591 [Nowakowskiella sp. JEL0407]